MASIELVHAMHSKYGFHDIVNNLGSEKFFDFLQFRAFQINEEVEELSNAIELKNAEEIIDALIDIKVFVDGTLDFVLEHPDHAIYAYDRVMRANMAKVAGIKPERKVANKFGFPDLLKPPGWTAPDLSEITSFLEKRLAV